MAERIGQMPDEEKAQSGTDGATEEEQGGCVCCEDEDDGRGKGDEGRAIEEIWGKVAGGHSRVFEEARHCVVRACLASRALVLSLSDQRTFRGQ